jgi:hypothetical protein
VDRCALQPPGGGTRRELSAPPMARSGSDDGGRRAAAVYTLRERKLNNIDPRAWLADVLARLPMMHRGGSASFIPGIGKRRTPPPRPPDSVITRTALKIAFKCLSLSLKNANIYAVRIQEVAGPGTAVAAPVLVVASAVGVRRYGVAAAG